MGPQATVRQTTRTWLRRVCGLLLWGGLVTGCGLSPNEAGGGERELEAPREGPAPASFSAREFPTEREPVPDGPVEALVPDTVVDLPTMKIQVVGKGRPWILLEGSAAIWHPTAQALADEFSVHVVTVAGMGGLPPVEGPLVERIVDDLRGYVRDLKPEKPILVVHGSLGARVGLELGSSSGQELSGLVLATAPPVNSGRFKLDAQARADHAKQLRRRVARTPREEWVKGIREQMNVLVANPHEGQRLAESRMRDDPVAGVELSLELLEDDGGRWLTKVQAPTLVVSACAETRSGPAAQKYCAAFEKEQRSLFRAIPNHEHIWMEQRGGLMMLDSPRAFSSILRAWAVETRE